MTAVTSLRGLGPAPAEELVNPVQLARRRNLAIFLVVIGLLSGWAFALNVPSRQHANLLVTPSLGPTLKLAAWYLPVQTTNLVLSVVTLACGAWMLARRRGTQTYALLSLGLVAFGFALVIWAGRGSQVSFIGLLTTAAVYSVPLIFGSLSGVLCERSGVINIAIEGQFLAGAFLGAMFGSLTHDLWIGMIAGALAGALMGALLAFLALRYQADQVIVGVVIVTFATGLTNFLSDGPLSTHQNTLNSPAVFRAWGIPGLDKIPFVGPVVFNQNIFWYLALGILVVVQVGLSSTRWGLRVKAVGEHPEAAESVGINVLAIRYRNVIVGGAVGGLGGAAFTIGSVGQFTAGISSGLGYVALAAMIFGGWRPLRAAAACLLFGFSDSLQNTLGLLNTPIPSALLAMLPYVITIVAVAGLVGRVRPPASDGIPYKRQ
jgi:general nucleoside transport system permease protein